jgi:hypothetical protein
MFIAEGSDWFWWYGDDHSSDHDLEFDDLFRRHVRNIYRALEKPIPEELFVTNITTQPPDVEIYRPTGFIAPVLDGDVTSYFEWVGAGSVDVGDTAGAMHRVAERPAGIEVVEFGFDLDNLFIRIDGTRPMRQLLQDELRLSINFIQPAGVRVAIQLTAQRAEARMLNRHRGHDSEMECPGLSVAVNRVLELQVPFRCLDLKTHSPVAFIVALQRGTTDIEHYPRHRAIELEVPDRNFAAVNWTA